MFGWLKRLFGIAKAETHAVLDKMEDPIKMTQQGIEDLKKDLTKSMQSLAEVKALHIRAKKELEAAVKREQDYENKAILLIQKAEKGELAVQEADRLASQALSRKEQISQQVVTHRKNVSQYEPMLKKMEANVQHLKGQISTWENEFKTLQARSKVSQATTKLNKQMAQVDSSDTLARLERMRDKVAEQEAMAESYEEIASANTSVDDEIDKVLGIDSNVSESDALAKLKAKMSRNVEGSNKSRNEQKQTPPNNPNEMSDLEKLKQKLKDSSKGAE